MSWSITKSARQLKAFKLVVYLEFVIPSGITNKNIKIKIAIINSPVSLSATKDLNIINCSIYTKLI